MPTIHAGGCIANFAQPDQSTLAGSAARLVHRLVICVAAEKRYNSSGGTEPMAQKRHLIRVPIKARELLGVEEFAKHAGLREKEEKSGLALDCDSWLGDHTG